MLIIKKSKWRNSTVTLKIQINIFICILLVFMIPKSVIAAEFKCNIKVNEINQQRVIVFSNTVIVPRARSIPDDFVLYKWGTNKITASYFVPSGFGIIWEEKPFGFRSGTIEDSTINQRSFFIEDGNISVRIECNLP